MTTDAWILVNWIMLGAAWLLSHAVLLAACFRSSRLTWPYKVAALVPVLTPLCAWKAGARIMTWIWVILLLGYVLSRSVGDYIIHWLTSYTGAEA